MTTAKLDPQRFPNLTGVEQPFYDFWSTNILRDDDPHRDRWIDYEEGAVERAQERNRLVQSVTGLDGERVLDVGCQNGAWLVALGQAGAIPTGIDVEATAVEAARIRTAAFGIDARAEVASACEMPFATGEFDIVASSDVLEHVPDKVAMLHECVRVLRPGGLLFLRAPVRFSLKHLRSDPPLRAPRHQHPARGRRRLDRHHVHGRARVRGRDAADEELDRPQAPPLRYGHRRDRRGVRQTGCTGPEGPRSPR